MHERDVFTDEGDDHVFTDECPEHGIQQVVSVGVLPGADPYQVNRLTCGHSVACFGPGEDNVLVGLPRKGRPRR